MLKLEKENLYRALRKKSYSVIENSTESRTVSDYVDLFLIGLIFFNAVAIVLQSIDKYDALYHSYFKAFEVFSIVVFSVEYIVRVWTCVEIPKYRGRITGRLKFSLTPYALIDFFAIISFYLPFIGLDLRFLRILRILRIFRILKIARYVRAVKIIGDVIKENRGELAVSFVFFLFVLLISSTLIYYIEHETQPEIFGSIPQSLWWSVVTITTVGYGDVYPITVLGRLLGGVVALTGIGILALPTGIIASGFINQISKEKDKKDEEEVKCPHCNKKFKH